MISKISVQCWLLSESNLCQRNPDFASSAKTLSSTTTTPMSTPKSTQTQTGIPTQTQTQTATPTPTPTSSSWTNANTKCTASARKISSTVKPQTLSWFVRSAKTFLESRKVTLAWMFTMINIEATLLERNLWARRCFGPKIDLNVMIPVNIFTGFFSQEINL